MKLDEGKLNAFVDKAVTDLAAGYGGVMTDWDTSSDSTRQWPVRDLWIHRN